MSEGGGVRRCGCGAELPPRGIKCAECRAVANRAKVARWAKNNPERIRAKARRLYHAKSAAINEKRRSEKYREKHGEKQRKRAAAWRAAHPEAFKTWAKTESGRAACHKARTTRRARKRAVPVTLTAEEWARSIVAWNNACAYCGKAFEPGDEITQDHVTPLARGGPHDRCNVVPCCRPCNNSKGPRDVREWMARVGLDWWAFNVRLVRFVTGRAVTSKARPRRGQRTLFA